MKAAVKWPCGKVTTGQSHMEACGFFTDFEWDKYEEALTRCIEGFVTRAGEFLTREQAYNVAVGKPVDAPSTGSLTSLDL